MRLFVALALVVAVAADPAAPHTLQEMVDSIKSGKFQNNVLPLLTISSTLTHVRAQFFGQKMVSATDVEAQVGGCLLDKVAQLPPRHRAGLGISPVVPHILTTCVQVGAIRNENGFAKFPNDLKASSAAPPQLL